MDLADAGLIAVAVAFVIANGANDGAALMSTALGITTRPWAGLAALLLALVAVPLLLGTAVARTLAERLVGFGDDGGRLALAGAVLAALAVVWVLTARGLPTSLTLGLVGGLSGSGFGAQLPVSWDLLGWVLLLGALAPLVGAVLAYGVSTGLGRIPLGEHASRRVHRAHQGAYLLQCLAYGLNDGQKMLAVAAIAGGTTVGVAAGAGWPLVLIAAAFAIGTLARLRRVGATIGGALVPLRPLRAAVAGGASAVAVIGTGVVGAPVSMTQSIAGGLVGSGLASSPSRVRWREAARIAGAWLFTLPAAFAVAAALALAARWVA